MRNYWNIFMNWSRLLIPVDQSPIKTLEESISRGFIPKHTCSVFSCFEIEHLSIETPHSIPQCQSLCTPRHNLLGDILLKHERKYWSIFLNFLRHLRPIDCSTKKKLKKSVSKVFLLFGSYWNKGILTEGKVLIRLTSLY